MAKKITFNFDSDSPDFYNVNLDEIAILTPYTLLTKNIGSDFNRTCNNITLYKNLCSTGASECIILTVTGHDSVRSPIQGLAHITDGNTAHEVLKHLVNLIKASGSFDAEYS